jgi:ssDNA-binding Zn-finger/Zn-ribbon topoisomerase 1
MEIKVETNKRICKKCNKIKMRIQNGKFPNGKDKRWVDESGSQWSGSVCPDCLREAAKLRKRSRKVVV